MLSELLLPSLPTSALPLLLDVQKPMSKKQAENATIPITTPMAISPMPQFGSILGPVLDRVGGVSALEGTAVPQLLVQYRSWISDLSHPHRHLLLSPTTHLPVMGHL